MVMHKEQIEALDKVREAIISDVAEDYGPPLSDDHEALIEAWNAFADSGVHGERIEESDYTDFDEDYEDEDCPRCGGSGEVTRLGSASRDSNGVWDRETIPCPKCSESKYPMCAEGGGHINDDNPGRPICRTCDDDPNVSALYPS